MKQNKADLVLVNPGNPAQVYQVLSKELAAMEPPVWVLIMASFMLRRGYRVEIIDGYAEGLSPAEVAERIADINPVLTAVVVYGHQPSASTQNMPASSAACQAIKKRLPDSDLMLVGGHVASLPQRTMEEEVCDYVCDGEGPYTFVDLIEALKAGRRGDLEKIPNLWYRSGGKLFHTTPAPLIKDLSTEVPDLPWHLIPMNRYRAHNWHCFGGDVVREPYASVYTTLGCPYHCSFCCIQAPFKEGEKAAGLKAEINSYRFWKPEVVVGWFEFLQKEHGVRNIKIADEMFVLNKRHVEGICDGIIQKGLDLNIWAYARVDTVQEELIDKMKRAGINWLAFGIESGSQNVRDDVNKGFDQADIFKTVERVRRSDIAVIGNYIFGLPDDNVASMQETLDLAVDLNCEFANFYCTMAYPGSSLYQMAVREGWQLPEKWSGYSQHSVDTLPLRTKHLSAAEVIKFRDEAFQKYFTSTRYLEMVRTKFGDKTVRHIKEMTAHKLIRQNRG